MAQHELLTLLDDLRRQAEVDLDDTKTQLFHSEDGVRHVVLKDEVCRREQAVTVWAALRNEAEKLVAELDMAQQADDTLQAEQVILSTIPPDRMAHIDVIVRLCGLTPAETTAILMVMEMKGTVRRLPGGYFERLPGAAEDTPAKEMTG